MSVKRAAKLARRAMREERRRQAAFAPATWAERARLKILKRIVLRQARLLSGEHAIPFLILQNLAAHRDLVCMVFLRLFFLREP